MERTLSIIKPDATNRNLTGVINSRFEKNGLRIIAQKRIQLTKIQATLFYYEHKDRVFFNALINSMVAGPIVVQILEGNDAVAKNREIMGVTNPIEAQEGTIRKDFGENIESNSVHGSDSPENAIKEIAFFFSHYEVVV